MEQFGFEVMILKWFRFLKNNIVIISISTIIGMAFLYGYSKYKAKVYKSNAVLYSSLVDDSRIEPMIEDLSTYVKKGSYAKLADAFGIPIEKVQDIKSLDIFLIEDQPSSNASILNEFNDYGENCFQIELKVNNPSALKELNAGILNYLEKNEFLRKIKEIREESIRNIILKIEAQITALEMVQKNWGQEDKGNIVINNESASLTRDLIQLMQAQAKYEELLKLSSIEVIKPFSIPERPESKTLLFLAAGAVLGAFFGLAFTFLRKLNTMI